MGDVTWYRNLLKNSSGGGLLPGSLTVSHGTTVRPVFKVCGSNFWVHLMGFSISYALNTGAFRPVAASLWWVFIPLMSSCGGGITSVSKVNLTCCSWSPFVVVLRFHLNSSLCCCSSLRSVSIEILICLAVSHSV